MRRFGATLVFLVASAAFAFVPLGVVTAPAASAKSGDPTVTIQSTGCGGALFCFSPASVTVNDGDTVTWMNASGVQHTVTRCNSGGCSGTAGGSGTDAGFTNGTIGPSNGSTFSHTFHGAGTYNYYCTIHGFGVMHGTVTVMAAATTTTAAPAAAPPAANSGSSGSSSSVPQSNAAAAATSSSSSSNLPHTGSDAQLLLAVAVVVMAVGALAVVASRRRTRADVH